MTSSQKKPWRESARLRRADSRQNIAMNVVIPSEARNPIVF